MKFLHKLKNELIGSGIYKFRHYGPRPLCFIAKENNSTIRLRAIGEPTLHLNFQYSFDRETWKEYILDSTIILSKENDKVYLKGNNPYGLSESYSKGIYFKFEMSGKIASDGNIMSLIDDGRCETKLIPNDYCFMYLFSGCNALIKAPELPATELTENCYYKMFQYCALLENAPVLPATTLTAGCYNGMFNNCIALTSTPELKATTLAESCYAGMFVECTNLVNISTLPAVRLYEQCYYYMFGNCSNLEKVPNLPAIELANNCYDYMFFGCAKLKISDTATTELLNEWKFGPFTNEITLQNMFTLCQGNRKSNALIPKLYKDQIYYIENVPI